MIDRKIFANFTTPIRVILIYLIVMAIWGTVSWGGDLVYFELQVIRLGLIYLGMVGSFFLMRRVGIKDSIRWEHRLITTLILYLLFDPLQSLWVFILAGAVAEILSRLLRSLTGPLFNPAGSAALILSAFGILPGWWGVSFAPRIPVIEGGVSVSALLTALVAGYVAYKYKKIPILYTLIPSFVVLVSLLFNTGMAVFLTLEGTALFYWMVMVVEPKTSPMMRNEQLFYGLVVGVLGAVLMKLNFLDPYLGALLVGNLIYFGIGFYLKRVRLVSPFPSKSANVAVSQQSL